MQPSEGWSCRWEYGQEHHVPVAQLPERNRAKVEVAGEIPAGNTILGEWFSEKSRPHRSRVCEPWRCKSSLAHVFLESKPQQTGTRLLTGHGEGETPSVSTSYFASWCNSSIPGFDPDGLGASPGEAASLGKSSFDRPMVKQDHVSPTKRC